MQYLLIDFFQNSIRLLKRLFLASFLINFSTICMHMLSKFIKKSAQKLLIFPIKASFERSLIFIFFIHILSCHATILETENKNPTLPTISPLEKQFFQTVVEGNNRFAFDLYEKMKNRPGNFCFSPYSILSGLAMVAIGTKGETAQQFQHTFHYSLSLLPLIGAINESLETVSPDAKKFSQAWLATAIWLQKEIPLLSSFKLAMQRNFKAPLKQLDFINATSQAIEEMNQWMSQKTAGKIKNFVTGQDITIHTRFILTTSLYAKGQWVQPFDLKETKREPFHISGERTLLSNMMHTTGSYLLAKGDKWDVVLLPYLSHSERLQLSITLILPKEIGIEELEKNLTISQWKQWISQLQMQKISLTLPRFRIENRFNLKETLKLLGLPFMFSSKADFSAMTTEQGLFVNEVIHKILIHIDEKGLETSTLLGVERDPPMKIDQEVPYEFLANRPFLFVIWDQRTESILFMGRVALP